MYRADYSSLGVATSWYDALVAKNTKASALVAWDTPATYAALFTEGWKLQDNRRYVTPYPTFELMVRAVDGIGKYVDQALTWAEQIGLPQYRQAAMIFTDMVLRQAQQQTRRLLDMVLYNSKTQYGFQIERPGAWNLRYKLMAWVMPEHIGMWTNPLTWASSWAEKILGVAPDFIAPMGWTLHTIIKTYNLAKRYKDAFALTARTGNLHPDLINLPELAEGAMLAQLTAAAATIDSSAGAVDLLQQLGALPGAPAYDADTPPILPDPAAEAAKPTPAWYWYAGALGVGAVGALIGIVLLRPKAKRRTLGAFAGSQVEWKSRDFTTLPEANQFAKALAGDRTADRIRITPVRDLRTSARIWRVTWRTGLVTG